MKEPLWLEEARKHVGVAEVPGPDSNIWINKMWLALPGGAWFWKTYRDDSKLPWCGAFIAYCFQVCGIPIPKLYASAKAWSDWGSRISAPVVGCVVVFSRDGGGHVGLVVGRTQDGNLLVLGGNQRDTICILPFSRARVEAYLWPLGIPMPDYQGLPMMTASGPLSTNEA